MTNYEKYKDDIIKTLLNNCENCQFNDECGSDTLRKWLDSEYVESEKEEVDWSKVPIDTKVLVSDDNGNWVRGYFAGYDRRNKVIYTFTLGATSWTNEDMGRTEWRYGKLAEDEE